MLTVEQLKAMPPETVFAQGITTNDPEGAYMTDYRRGDKMNWVAIRGQIWDWAIYANWEGEEPTQGEKVFSKEYIQRLVPCNEEAFNMYRK